MSVATVLFVLWNAVAHHEGGTRIVTLLLNSVVGLLAAWAVLRLSLDIVSACELRVRAETASPPSMASIRNQQGELITMCAWTKRVKQGGRWVSIEEYLDQQLNVVVSHGIADDLKAGLIAHHSGGSRDQ